MRRTVALMRYRRAAKRLVREAEHHTVMGDATAYDIDAVPKLALAVS